MIVKDIAAQGDVTFIRVGALPDENLRPAAPDAEGFIVAHSETGHHHVARLHGGTQFLVPSAPESGLVAYLQSENEIDIEHLRSFDTHAPLKLAPGIWKVQRQREWSPEQVERNVAD